MKKNKRQLTKKEKLTNDLRIYSPAGELLFVGKEGFNVDYQSLIKQARRKWQISHVKRSF